MIQFLFQMDYIDDSINEKYEARYLFEHYSDSIARLDYLSTNSSNDDRDSLIYFFRKIESVSSNKEPFNLRLCFIRKGNKYYFNELVIF